LVTQKQKKLEKKIMTTTFEARLVTAVYETSEKYAAAVRYEMELEDGRATVKLAAIDRIMKAGDNAMTGKPHSFSSAEAAVNTDREYADYLGKQREAVVERILAKARYEAALLEGRLYGEKD
jgi:hypothetical protein